MEKFTGSKEDFDKENAKLVKEGKPKKRMDPKMKVKEDIMKDGKKNAKGETLKFDKMKKFQEEAEKKMAGIAERKKKGGAGNKDKDIINDVLKAFRKPDKGDSARKDGKKVEKTADEIAAYEEFKKMDQKDKRGMLRSNMRATLEGVSEVKDGAEMDDEAKARLAKAKGKKNKAGKAYTKAKKKMNWEGGKEDLTEFIEIKSEKAKKNLKDNIVVFEADAGGEDDNEAPGEFKPS